MTLFSNLRDRMEKHARYRQTLNELRSVSPDVANDLNLGLADMERVARKAVYGH